VKVDVIEGGDASGHGATAIGKCVIDELPASLPPKSPIVVVFKYEQNGRLTVDAKLPHAERHATLAIERASGLSDSLLKMWQQRIAAGLQLGQGQMSDDAGQRSSIATQAAGVQPPPVQTADESSAASAADPSAVSWLQSDNAELDLDGFVIEDEPEPPPVQTSPPALRPKVEEDS
jgi:hypothetical protein